jgi:primary-amine oxidase
LSRHVVTLIIVAFFSLPSARASAHPLDPLTGDEIRAATAIAKSDVRLAKAAFASIVLQEPSKADVLASASGRFTVARQARIVAMVDRSVFEAVVDLDARRLASVAERRGVEPSVLASEFETAKIVLTNPQFRAGLERRGITDFAKLFCSPFMAGYYAIPEHEGRRTAKIGCFDTRRTTTNMWGWPIERLYAMVDLRSKEVLSVTDDGVVPIAPGDHNFTEAAVGDVRTARKPTILSQPEGANFTVDGHEVSWGQWRFHARIDARVGTVISVARWQDTSGPPRSVLYQGYLSEMFVPYMDSAYGWYTRTYFDTGEYGAGILASPLKAGVDCPATATFMPATFATETGEPMITPNALCVFERSGGDPIWRHYEGLNQTYEGRANVELVVRMASTIGNYDYLMDWVFTDAAEIEVRLGATGIDAVKGVATTNMTDATAAADTRYGTLVAPNLVAVNHDHYFNFRLDLDVDGAANTFNQDFYTTTTLPDGTPRRSVYVVEPRLIATEKAGRFDAGHGPSKLRVVNEARTNDVGNPVSYEVMATSHARLSLDPEDWPAKRASFLKHDVWVTAFAPTERYAGGEYMVTSRGNDGLLTWSERDRPIRNQDIVVWVNLGMHHLTRAEDLPVMPTVWHSFRLRPHNFFNRNPAIDLPRIP